MELTIPTKTLVHCSGSVSRENSVQVLATTTDLGSDRNKLLSTQNKIKPTVTDRAEVMEGKFTSSEWQTIEKRNAKVNHPNGCFQNNLGAVYLGTTMGRIRSYQERAKYINVLELFVVKLPILTFTKRKSVTSIHLQIDNMKALPALLGKNGQNSQSRSATNSQGSMGLSVS